MSRELTTRPHGGVQPGQSVPLFQQVMGGLAKSAEDWEAPVSRVRGALAGLMPVIKGGVSIHGPMRDRREAARWLELAPPLAHWLRLEEEAGDIGRESPDRGATMLLVGMMLDAFPTAGREPRDGYYATLVHEIMADEFGPSIVATACRELRRSSRFLPTVSEALEACATVRDGIGRGADTIRLAVLRGREAAALKAAEPATPQSPPPASAGLCSRLTQEGPQHV